MVDDYEPAMGPCPGPCQRCFVRVISARTEGAGVAQQNGLSDIGQGQEALVKTLADAGCGLLPAATELHRGTDTWPSV